MSAAASAHQPPARQPSRHTEVDEETSDQEKAESRERGRFSGLTPFPSPVTWLLIVLAVSLTLRVYRLPERSMWFDESVSWTTATQFTWGEAIERTTQAVHPPLYYMTLRLWTGVAGSSLVAMRSLSVILAGVTIAGVYFFCRDAFAEGPDEQQRGADHGSPAQPLDGDGLRSSRWIGVTAAALVGASSIHIVWAQEARMYMLGTALSVWSSWLLVRGLRAASPTPSLWIAYAVTLAALLYTHNYGLFTAAAHGVFLAGYLLSRGASAWRMPAARWAAGALLAAGLLYAPWLPVLFAQADRVQANYWIGPLHAWSVPNAWYDLLVPQNDRLPRDRVVVVGLLGMLTAALAGMLWKGRAADRLVVLLVLVPVVGAVAISVVSAPIIVSRYFLFAHLFALCAVARSVWLFLAGPARPIAVAVLLVNSLIIHVDYWNALAIAQRPGLRGAVAWILEQRQADEPLVVVHPALYHAARYYVGEAAPVMLYAEEELTHFNGGPLMVPEDLLDRPALERLSAERVWVIDSTGFRSSFPRFRLPAPWRPIGQAEPFAEAHFFQEAILAGQYERGESQEASNAKY